jgi:hypothetical protein
VSFYQVEVGLMVYFLFVVYVSRNFTGDFRKGKVSLGRCKG